MSTLSLELAQLDLHWEDATANTALVEAWLKARPDKVDVILLPELWSTAFSMRVDALAEPPEGPAHTAMAALAQKRDALVAGSVMVKDGEAVYNRLYAVLPDGTTHTYDKVHLFRMGAENDHYHAGRNQRLQVEWRGWQVVFLTCYDLRFPIWARNSFAFGDNPPYDLLCFVANWPARRTDHWSTLLKARAIENQAYVAGVNRVGADGNDVAHAGDSAVFNPLGQEVTAGQALPHREALLTADLDREALQLYRQKFPAWMDADRFQLLD